MYDTILVATDGSDGATAATTHAIDLAAGFDAALYAVAVVETRTAYDSDIVDPDVVERRLRERAEDALAELEAEAGDAGVSVESTVRAGTPHEEIVAVAADRDADLVVVGAQGQSEFKRALLGSTVDGVVRFADRPVLVVDS